MSSSLGNYYFQISRITKIQLARICMWMLKISSVIFIMVYLFMRFFFFLLLVFFPLFLTLETINIQLDKKYPFHFYRYTWLCSCVYHVPVVYFILYVSITVGDETAI